MGKIGPKDQHGSDSDGEGEKCLAHCGEDDIAPANFCKGINVRYQIKTDPRFGSLKEEGMDGKDDHEA